MEDKTSKLIEENNSLRAKNQQLESELRIIKACLRYIYRYSSELSIETLKTAILDLTKK